MWQSIALTLSLVAKEGRGSSPQSSRVQTKHKHTFKLHEIYQFGQFIYKKIIKNVATRSLF